MTFGAAIKHGLQNLTNFKGRARRSEFWWYYLFITLISIPLVIVAMIPMFAAMGPLIDSADPVTGEVPNEQLTQFLGALGATYLMAFLFGAITFFLILAVWVRRLHDGGYSGHWLWLSLVGLSIVPLIFAFFDSKWGPNQWGEDPKAAERGIAAPLPQAPYPYPAAPYGAPTQAPPTQTPPAQATPPTQAPPASAQPTDPFATPPQ